jgi:hypothetical protein
MPPSQAARLAGAIPGSVAALHRRQPYQISTTPLRHGHSCKVVQRDRSSAIDSLASPSASYVLISPRYLDVVKIPLVDGRAFDDRDNALVSFLVADRAQEIGIGLALGATPTVVVRIMMRRQ